MSKGEVVFTTAAVTGLLCVVAAALCTWVVLTDPASLIPAQPESAGSLLDVAARMVARATSVILGLIGWS